MYDLAPLSPEPLSMSIESGADFFADITSDVAGTVAGDRIALVTMSFEPKEPKVHDLLEALHAAAERGVEVHFATDAYAFLVDNTSASIGPLLLPNTLRQGAFKGRKQALEALNDQASATVNLINEPNRWLRNPFAGRSHIKAAVVNNTVYDVGPNLHVTDRTDLAVRFESAPIADKLYGTLVKLVETGSTDKTFGGEDQVWQLDETTQLLIDGGKPGQSIIMDQAIDMIDSAQEIVVGAFQYFPRGIVADALADAALRGVDVYAFHNHPHVQGLLGRYPEMYAMRNAGKLAPGSSSLHMRAVDTHLHSKGLSNESSGMAGSHNFDPRGVRFGTSELVIVRHTPQFARQLGEFLFSQANLTRQQSRGQEKQDSEAA